MPDAGGALIRECEEAVFSGEGIGAGQARRLMGVADSLLPELAAAADRITRGFNGDAVDMEQLNNIKRGACSEDCSFCGQSALYVRDPGAHGLPEPGEVAEAARRAREGGATSYCLVAAWRGPPTDAEFARVCEMVAGIAGMGMGVECSLGFILPRQAARLKELGVRRYNHNLETARSKFPEICSTHAYDDRLETLGIAREAGLELCTGGIIGMGETRAQRLELALELARLEPEEVALNILVPVEGTPLRLQAPLPDGEALRMFAAVRFMLPASVVKISGGREAALGDEGRALLRGGANGIITAGYLTMGGNDPGRDAAMVREVGLSPGRRE